MLKDELINLVEQNLNIPDTFIRTIASDVIHDVLNYCNLTELSIELEPFIRKKVKAIINYEKENGTTSSFDIKSIKEGDTSITYNVDESTSKDTIYGLSDRDKTSLKAFRRTRK